MAALAIQCRSKATVTLLKASAKKLPKFESKASTKKEAEQGAARLVQRSDKEWWRNDYGTKDEWIKDGGNDEWRKDERKKNANDEWRKDGNGAWRKGPRSAA